MSPVPSPWTQTAAAVLESLGSRAGGLSAGERAARLEQYGPNRLPTPRWRHGMVTALSQFTNPLVLVLIAAAVISGFLGEETEAAVIVAIVVINGLLGFVQEYRAERALRALREFITREATVRRDGQLVTIPLEQVVPGDVVHIEIGDVVPADLRLLSLDDLSTDEAALTGESLPVAKQIEPVRAEAGQPHQLLNMAFMGTAVASGYAEGVAVATGAHTWFGRAAGTLAHKPHETDFQKNLRRFSDFLLKITVALTAFVFLANALLDKGLFDSFLFALALAVGITPEALPIIVTIALSNGALRMARDKVVAKRLISVEDLGNIDVLCCDKTGTLTEGEVSLHDYVDLEGARSPAVLLGGLLTSAPSADRTGNPIDRATLRRAADVAGELDRHEVLDRNAFDYRRRRVSALVKAPDGSRRLYVKGACEAVLDAGQGDGARIAAARQRAATLERAGYRVIAVADKPMTADTSRAEDEAGLTLRGFLLFLDPPKPAVRESLQELQALGVRVSVISGDSAEITRRICEAVNLPIQGQRVVTGPELEPLDDAALAALVTQHNVYARATPETKARLVTALGTAGHIVGFLGDGVNDAPALRVADVGISVDSGTDIAKDAADIVLLQKSLAVIAHGIREGRRTFGNITKYIFNTISANFGNMFTVAVSSLVLPFIPLLPPQILLNNLLSDLPLVTISTDRVDEEFLHRPRRWDIGMIGRFMVWFGLLSAVFDLALIAGLLGGLKIGVPEFRTAWFVESACSEILVTFAIRTRLPFYRSRPARLLAWSSLAAAALVVALPFTPAGTSYFAFVPPSWASLGLVAAVLVSYFGAAELAKRQFFRHVRL
ncbi:MAG: magnesium-translocating P-type ATPase [Gemmatimonadetes bacterium]|nr:magnesium-translocating P-type ATPase [Gemmatimonadota bacterium]